MIKTPHDCINHICTSVKIERILRSEYDRLGTEDCYVVSGYHCCCDRKLTVVTHRDIHGNEAQREMTPGTTCSGFIIQSCQPYFHVSDPICGKVCDECKVQKCDEFFGNDDDYCKLCINAMSD